ncbi:esterase/lipase family protein [Actinokineospora enzanensis]|uniref:esterase/lipase family protein n=1 Tax=Actinokineospora enzanensis TaxID=155975 RepID=UPI00036476BA|nr:alpha/beta hydrolase [Actinokineospora enzanensis]
MRRVLAIVGVVLAFVLLCAAPASAQEMPKQCDGKSTAPDAGQSSAKRPVVFVHGWTGDPMGDSAGKLAGQLDGKISTFTFDYSRWASYWASDEHIAPCLAAYLMLVSGAYEKAGGDGRIIVVAHSMGGLALRYASSPALAARVPYVITLGTPQLGSPWGGADGLSRINEVVRHVFGKELPPTQGKDGGKCLAEHQRGSSLPSGCGGLPPYLPKGMNLTQIAGDITVKRTFFGLTAYSIPLFSDGIVPVPSAHGYPPSGPTGLPPEDGAKSYTRTDSCSVDFGLVNQAAHSLAFAASSMAFDYLTLQDLQKDRFSAPVQAYLGGATITAACSHLRLPTDQSAVNQMTEVVKSALGELGKPAAGNATKTVNVAAVDKSGNPASGYTVADDTGDVDMCSASPVAVAADIVSCSPSAAGAIACWPGPDRHALLCGGLPWEKKLYSAHSTESVPAADVPPSPQPWGLELANGMKCVIRNGGAWGGRADGYTGAYSCQPSSDVVLAAPDQDTAVDRSGPVWTVKVGQLGDQDQTFPPPTTQQVRTAYFATS